MSCHGVPSYGTFLVLRQILASRTALYPSPLQKYNSRQIKLFVMLVFPYHFDSWDLKKYHK